MNTDPNALAYEIKIIMKADGSRGIESVDGNGNGMSVLQVREALQWALMQVQDQVTIALATAAVVDAQKKDRGIIVPNLV